MARPRKEFDREEFEKLCALQCTEKEICAWFSTTDTTLSKWCKRTYGVGFKDAYNDRRQMGLISLRRAQFKHAEKSAAMAMFLGRNILGQKDGRFPADDDRQEKSVVIIDV